MEQLLARSLIDPQATAPLARAGCVAAGLLLPSWLCYKAVVQARRPQSPSSLAGGLLRRSAGAGAGGAGKSTSSSSVSTAAEARLKYFAVAGAAAAAERLLLGADADTRNPYWAHAKLAFVVWLQCGGADKLFDVAADALRYHERKVDGVIEAGAAVLELYRDQINHAAAAVSGLWQWLVTPDDDPPPPVKRR